MAVAQVNVGFQVKIKELEDQMKKANASFRAAERSFKTIGTEFTKTGQMISNINPEIGGTIGRFGQLGSLIPQVGKEMAKLNIIARANPWVALAVALSAAAVTFAALASKMSDAAKVQKLFGDAALEAEKSIAKERVQIGLLVNAARDETKSRSERLSAIKAINAVSAEYLGNITLEAINTKGATDAIDSYVGALRAKAKEQAIAGRMTELMTQRIDLETKALGEVGAVQNAFNSVWRMFGIETENLFTSRAGMEEYIKTQKMSVEQANAMRAAFEPLLKVRDKELASIDAQMDALGKLAGTGGIEPPKDSTIEGTIKFYNDKIALERKNQTEVALTSAEYAKSEAIILSYQKKIDAIENKKEKPKPRKKLEAIQFKPPAMGGTLEWYDDLINRTYRLRDAQIIGTAAWEKYNLEAKSLEAELKVKLDTNSFQAAEDALNNLHAIQEQNEKAEALLAKKKAEEAAMYASVASEAFGVLGQSIVDSMGMGETAMERFTQAMMEGVLKILQMALAQAISNAIIVGTKQGVAEPFAMPAFIASAVGTVMTAFASIPKFADGGVVYGPTLGLMGEYAGAANNPEVIAPLSKLKDLIAPSGGDVTVSLGLGSRISGSDLELVIERVIKRNNRTR